MQLRFLFHIAAPLAAIFCFCSFASVASAQEAAPAADSPPADSAAPAEGADDKGETKPEDEAKPEDETKPEDEAKPEEAAAAAAAVPEKAEVDPYAEAKERVSRAISLFNDENYDAALTEFLSAYETMEGHPARSFVLFNVGKCYEKLYDYSSAIDSYRLYLKSAAEDAPDRAEVKMKIDMLEGYLGTLKISVSATKGALPADYEVWVDKRLIKGKNTEFLLPGGNHQIEVRAEGFESASQEVQLPARSEKSLNFQLIPLAKEYKGLPSVYFWTASSIAVGAAITGGAFGLAAAAQRSSLDDGPSEGITEDDVDSLEQKAMIADIFFVSAGVFATTAVILGFMTDFSGGEDEEEEVATRPGYPEKSRIKVKDFAFVPSSEGAFFSLRGAF